jgi:hypothetical protein
VLCCVVLCCVVLYCVVLCCVVLCCYAMLLQRLFRLQTMQNSCFFVLVILETDIQLYALWSSCALNCIATFEIGIVSVFTNYSTQNSKEFWPNMYLPKELSVKQYCEKMAVLNMARMLKNSQRLRRILKWPNIEYSYGDIRALNIYFNLFYTKPTNNVFFW